ncbi:LysR family substrate-binding domain-containing protein [Pseudonocardia hispaniensis]|uniref:LysR family substrate-binding domain-containing protein n=1 Tax=Pseudonocardia hispaniensis TaxID=904933 RepID=A0ABW1J056_9PSEU
MLGRVLRLVRLATGRLPLDLRSDLLTPTQLDGIVDGRIDIGFMVRPDCPPPAELVMHTLLVESLAVVLPDGHPLAGYDAVPLAEMANDDFVSFPADSGSAVRWLFENACRTEGFQPRIVHEARDTGTLLGLVAAGLGSAVFPLSVRDGAAAGVTVRPLAEHPPVEIVMVWRRTEQRRLVREVVDTINHDFGSPQRPGRDPEPARQGGHSRIPVVQLPTTVR